MGKIKGAILVIMLVLITPVAVLATSWTPYYFISWSATDPTSPPGVDWTEWGSGANSMVESGQYFWIGADNDYQPDATKYGTLIFRYNFTGGAYPQHLGQAAGDGDFQEVNFTVQNVGELQEEETVEFVIFPQPGWEWFKFQNLYDPGYGPGTITITAITIETTCVPLPGALWLLGPGLLGLIPLSRLKKYGITN